MFIFDDSLDTRRWPPAWREIVQKNLAEFAERLTKLELAEHSAWQHPAWRASLPKVWLCSPFVARLCIQQPALCVELLESGDLFSATRRATYRSSLSALSFESESALMTALRRFRAREMLRIAWRDLAGWADLPETLHDLSALAEATLQYTVDWLYCKHTQQKGTPYRRDGRPQQLVVLGMGKLGGNELNFSSDIDLIFAYAENGELPGRQGLSYGEFFTRLARSLIKILDEVTADGFVFRVDTRLRPFGDSGPLVMNFDGMENYYQTQAREWERYAMIKARSVAGDFTAGAELMDLLQPFVYRRYLDFGAIDEIRALKEKISAELKRKDQLDNLKLGPGGIREIEFIGQAFQLVHGGKEKRLQQRSILPVLDALAALGMLGSDEVARLREGYILLRRVENRLQQYLDQQTHQLPNDAEQRDLLAYSLDYPDWEHCAAALQAVRDDVHAIFQQIFTPRTTTTPCSGHDGIANCEQFMEWGYEHAESARQRVEKFRYSAAVRRMTRKGLSVLERLLPLIAAEAASHPHAEIVLQRVLDLFEAIAGRNVYLVLLLENPGALRQLIKLVAASPWLCDYLAQYPVVFDELLDPRALYRPLDLQSLRAECQTLISDSGDDLEQAMIRLRQFKQINVLRVAAADISGTIPLMVVSDYLTYIAEAILEQALRLAWSVVVAKHGRPPDASDEEMGFAVLGFGKLGGWELGYGSDLDLVLLYDCPDDHALTLGERPLTCSQFYGRLGQRLVSILDSKMLSGTLYELDMRLRPNGNAGLLVNHLHAYRRYLRHDAWTWEHQALVRGRCISGDRALGERFAALRREILAQRRDLPTLRQAVRDMREKMRDNLALKEPGRFDLKQGVGGITDIEFIVQFMVLAHAAEHPALTVHTDNVRLLDALAQCGLLTAQTTQSLKTAYCAYRDLGHRAVLQGQRGVVSEEEIATYRAAVIAVWHRLLETETP